MWCAPKLNISESLFETLCRRWRATHPVASEMAVRVTVPHARASA